MSASPSTGDAVDWQRRYYVLALRVVTAQVALGLGDQQAAAEALNFATDEITALERADKITALERADDLLVVR